MNHLETELRQSWRPQADGLGAKQIDRKGLEGNQEAGPKKEANLEDDLDKEAGQNCGTAQAA